MQKEKVFYDYQWFLDFYKSKDPKLCITGALVKQLSNGSLAYDALGWLHNPYTAAWDKFKQRILLNLAPNITQVWDGKMKRFSQSTPIERVVAYLTYLKESKINRD